MMHEDIEVRPSNIHGKGLFARKLIPKDTITWIIDFDAVAIYSEEEYYKLSYEEQEEIYHFGWDYGDLTILFLDDAKFENHSDNPNLKSYFSYEIALRDIQKDEELTVNYREAQGYE